MEKKINTKAISAFFKRNLYYILTGVCVIVIATVITLAVVLGNANKNTNVDSPVIDEPSGSINNNPPTENLPEMKDPEPVIAEEVFIYPVLGTSQVIREFSLTEPVYSEELQQFAVHTGIDIAGEENAKVVSVLSGTVENVSEKLHEGGYTVTIKSDKGITCIYSSLGSDIKVAVGDKVSQGQEIGVISTSYNNEYMDAAHLHFQVKVNGQYVDPVMYLVTEEK